MGRVMIPAMSRILFCAACSLILFAACDKKSRAIPKPSVQPPAPAAAVEPKPPISAPKEIPQSLKERVTRDWPSIEKEGEAFLESFNAARTAKSAGDRDKMDVAVEAARAHFNAALEKWNGIYYSVDDLNDERLAEKCRRWLRKWNRKVDSWTVKAKGLKEFSRVK